MRKFLIFLITVMFAFSVAGCDKSGNLEDKTYDFLESKGYTKEDVEGVEIDHSFINKVLGYNEWRIFVEFKSEPNIIFAFTYRDGEIIKQGIKSENGQLRIDEIREYDEKFANGELKND